jgi:microsomal dipeptidase-like Zn-dependent dipeptidase
MNIFFNNSDRRNFIKSLGLLGGSTFLYSFNWGEALSNHERSIFIDGLSFLPDNLEELTNSGLTAGIFDLSNGEVIDNNYVRTFKACKKSIKSALKLIEDNGDKLILATDASAIEKASQTNKTALFIQLQGGGEALDGKIENLNYFQKLGLSVFQMTHHYNNPFAGGALVRNPSGLTNSGVELVEVLNNHRILIDLSHASDLTAHDVLDKSKSPVIISHGGCRKFVNHPRCSPDDIIRRVGESGGVMGVFMMSFWLTKDIKPTIDHYIQNIKHVVDVAGIESVAIANDFSIIGEKIEDGSDNNDDLVKLYVPWWNKHNELDIYGFENIPPHVVIPELNNVNRLFLIKEALLKNGFNNHEVDLVMGGNWQRVLKECLR